MIKVVALVGECIGLRPLHAMGLPKVARQKLTNTLRPSKGRPQQLMRVLRYQCPVAYAESGQRAGSRGAIEMLYASDPDYEDVARRLGLA